MSHKRTGYKRVEDDMNHEGYNPVIDAGRRGRGKAPPTLEEVFLRPFSMTERRGKPHTSLAVGVWTWLLTFIGCMLFAIVFLLVLNDQVAAANPSTSAFIVALVGGIFTIGPMMWTFDTDLRIHTIPGILVANVGTLDLGIVTAIIFLLAQFGGYAVGGVIVRALLGVVAVADTATGVASYWMAWAATSVVIFVYIYNDKFEFHREYEIDNHSRATYWTGIWSIGFRLSLYSLGLRTLNAGLYMAALILSNDGDLTPADNVVDWAFYIFVQMLASAATAFLLYYVASFFVRFKRYALSPKVFDAEEEPDYQNSESRATGRYGADVRSRAGSRKLDGEF